MESKVRSLCDTYKGYFPIGAAISKKCIPNYQSMIREHFNSLTPENEFKFIETQPLEGVFTLSETDAMVKFAMDGNQLIRGHVLIWHQQTPDWVFVDQKGEAASRELVLSRMKEHIQHIVSRYQGKVYCWDVVNEAIDDDDALLRDTKWLSTVGPDYIDHAFLYAHEADPSALLFYNDYNDMVEVKHAKIYQLVKGMKERGIPIHGLGLQAHFSNFFPSVEDIRRSIEDFASLGLQLQITEMDLSVYQYQDNSKGRLQPTEDMLKLQAEKYQQIFEVYREYKDIIRGVTFWGIADDYTWLDDYPVKERKDWPLLFDEQKNPKPAFYAITSFADKEENSYGI